jgi:hypothetical protein
MRLLPELLRILSFGWIVALRDLIRLIAERSRLHKRRAKLSDRERKRARASCVPIDRPEMKRPDPLIYSQPWLRSLGLDVTWNNPDIEVSKDGAAVPSGQLLAGTTYDVVARIWNASTDAAAILMPVRFSYLSFGVGAAVHPIESTLLTVGAKGSPDQPAFAKVQWTTPTTPGHYCIQVLLEPVDDRNYANNMGYENTQVGHAESPVPFEFELRNDMRRHHRYRFAYDAYTVRERPPCHELPRLRDAELRRRLLSAHAAGKHPLPAEWRIHFNPDNPSLAPGASTTINVIVTPPDGFAGTQLINVNAIRDDGTTAGGVTLTVVKA